MGSITIISCLNLDCKQSLNLEFYQPKPFPISLDMVIFLTLIVEVVDGCWMVSFVMLYSILPSIDARVLVSLLFFRLKLTPTRYRVVTNRGVTCLLSLKTWSLCFDPHTKWPLLQPIWMKLSRFPLELELSNVFWAKGNNIRTFMEANNSYQKSNSCYIA